MALALRGNAMSLPFGVKQKTWSWKSSSLVCSRNSSGFEPSASNSMVCRSQAYALDSRDSISVGENIEYPLKEHFPEMPVEERLKRVARVLGLVNLPGIETMRPSDLSGGMRRRVGLARAIATDPEVILWDEPTTGLDPISTRTIDELIRSMRAKLRCTSIVVTHDMQSAFTV